MTTRVTNTDRSHDHNTTEETDGDARDLAALKQSATKECMVLFLFVLALARVEGSQSDIEARKLSSGGHHIQARISAVTASLHNLQQDIGKLAQTEDKPASLRSAKRDKASTARRAASFVNGTRFTGDKVSSAQNARLRTRLRAWAQVINGRSSRYVCKNASVPRAVFRQQRTARQARGYGTRDADSWHVCYDNWEPWKTGCIGVSIGIGGEWGFEDGLAQNPGCHVHAFDPTEELRVRHTSHANNAEQNGRMHFEASGLGGDKPQANTKSLRYGGFDPNTTSILPLDVIMRKATALRESKVVDVLKIDCEGCEWTAFTQVARSNPNLLLRVRMIMIEIHAIQRYGLHRPWEVDRLLDFLITHHGFRVYRSGLNKGWPGARNQIRHSLVQAGFPHMPCCWLLHLIRPPSNTSWLSASESAAASSVPYEYSV